MNTKGTLLCIIIGTEGYGIRQVWADLLTGLQSRGWRVVVAVLEANFAPDWQDFVPGATVVAAERISSTVSIAQNPWRKALSLVRRFLRQTSHIGWLTRLARATDTTAILVQTPPETPLAALVAWRLGLHALWLVPNVISTSYPLDLNRRIYRLLFRFFHLIPVSNSRYTDSTFGSGAFKRYVVHLGVDTEFYVPGADAGAVRQRFGIPEDAPLIGLFARMDPSKGQARLIEALASSGIPSHLLLCGGPTEGAYFDELRARIEQHNLASRVHLAGPQGDLRPYYAACDLIASLLDFAEGFGLTVVEAMACGKPVLAHQLGGPSETIVDGCTGWLLRAPDVATIAAGLARALAHRDAWIDMGAKGRERVEIQFKKGKFVAAVEELIAKNRQPTAIGSI